MPFVAKLGLDRAENEAKKAEQSVDQAGGYRLVCTLGPSQRHPAADSAASLSRPGKEDLRRVVYAYTKT